MAMASDRAIAQAWREFEASTSPTGWYEGVLKLIGNRAAELDATPPAGAGEAVLVRGSWLHESDVLTLQQIIASTYTLTNERLPADVRDYLRNLAGRIPNVPTAAPTPLPEAVREADELLAALGLDASRFRTEGGALNAGKVRAALLHPESYSGLYLPNDHDFGHSAKFGGELCFACGAVKGTARASQPCVALRAITGEGKP
jgi:hypothetical protein